jgi:hypothetical protein
MVVTGSADVVMLPSSAYADMTTLPKVDTKCTTPSLIPTYNGNTVRSFSSHGQQSAAKGSLTTVCLSRSDNRLIKHFDSSAHGLVRRWRLIGYFPSLYNPPQHLRRVSESVEGREAAGGVPESARELVSGIPSWACGHPIA